MLIDTNVLIYGLSAFVALLLGVVAYLWVKVNRLLRGKDAKTLEDTLNTLIGEVKELSSARREIERYLSVVEERLKRSIQGVSTLRFNPFREAGQGGNQSFATSFLDENGNGVVVSSLYSRDRVSIFAKPVKSGRSEYELSDEERASLESARPKKLS